MRLCNALECGLCVGCWGNSAVLSGPEGPATITRRVPDTENEWRTSKVHGYQLFKKGIRPFMESTDETTGERHNKARLRSDQNKLKRAFKRSLCFYCFCRYVLCSALSLPAVTVKHWVCGRTG